MRVQGQTVSLVVSGSRFAKYENIATGNEGGVLQIQCVERDSERERERNNERNRGRERKKKKETEKERGERGNMFLYTFNGFTNTIKCR